MFYKILHLSNLVSPKDHSKENLAGAKLSGMFFGGADLRGMDMYQTNFTGAYLNEADLRGANLSLAIMSKASLKHADLRCANLQGADLRETDLRGADLTKACLHGSYLRGADLRGADLRWTDLKGADLYETKLKGAKLPQEIVPEEGEFVGWKKCMEGVVKLLIPADARRMSALTSRKCRADKVLVLETPEGKPACSRYEPYFWYEQGETVEEPDYDPDRRVECSRGIHFFMTRKEAEEYGL